MLTYPEIDPVALDLGRIKIHWYGLMYLIGFACAWFIGMHRGRQPWSPVKSNQVEDLVFYAALGVVIGGRIGYVFFYNFGQFLDDPLWLFRVWEGGMSFHGGAIGVLVAMALFARRLGQSFLRVMDFVVVLAPAGLLCGRIGNFIGQELWGRETTSPLGMIFPKDPDALIRHPSQLYEAVLEGLVLFVVLFWFSRRQRPAGSVGALFLMGYGVFRFGVEFFREPDAHIQFDLFGWMTRGQILTTPMMIVGLIFFIGAYMRQASSRR